MNKELEETIKILNKLLHRYSLIDYRFDNMLTTKQTNAIETLVQALENSIPTSVVEEKIKELDKLIVETQKELGSASKEYTIYVYQKSILKELLQEK